MLKSTLIDLIPINAFLVKVLLNACAVVNLKYIILTLHHFFKVLLLSLFIYFLFSLSHTIVEVDIIVSDTKKIIIRSYTYMRRRLISVCIYKARAKQRRDASKEKMCFSLSHKVFCLYNKYIIHAITHKHKTFCLEVVLHTTNFRKENTNVNGSFI